MTDNSNASSRAFINPKPHPSRAIPRPPPISIPPVAAVIYDPETGKILQSMRGHEIHIANSSSNYLVVPEYRIDYDATHKVEDGALVELPPISQDIIDARAAVMVRRTRDKMILESDWTETPGGIRRLGDKAQAWVDYRQELFDLPTRPGFPNQIVWPKTP